MNEIDTKVIIFGLIAPLGMASPLQAEEFVSIEQQFDWPQYDANFDVEILPAEPQSPDILTFESPPIPWGGCFRRIDCPKESIAVELHLEPSTHFVPVHVLVEQSWKTAASSDGLNLQVLGSSREVECTDGYRSWTKTWRH